MHDETRCSDRIKLIFWDGTGLCLFAERLEDGIFRWPKIEDRRRRPGRPRTLVFPLRPQRRSDHKAKYTLFDGMNVPFLIEAVMLQGNAVYSDGLDHERRSASS
jgi:transposase